jgi:hypothetical protein
MTALLGLFMLVGAVSVPNCLLCRVLGHYATLVECEEVRDRWLKADPSGPHRCVPE